MKSNIAIYTVRGTLYLVQIENDTYKLYVGNRFYNIVVDPQEKFPLKQKDLTLKERKIYNIFAEALGSYIVYRRE